METTTPGTESVGTPNFDEEILESTINEKYNTQCWISSESVGENLSYEFLTMPGSSPKAMGHQLLVYDNPEPSIPRSKRPRAQTAVSTNDTRGSGYFEDSKIGMASYVLGYATGPGPKQVVALSFIPESGGRITTINPDLGNLKVGISHVSVDYTLAPGALPNSDGDYIGIKEGQNFVDLYWGNFLWWNRVTSNDSSGTAYINNTSILRGKSYLLGYYKSDYCRGDLAVACRFSVK
ncbi:hypothetical protein GCM10009678_78810 [Actinomadura kijaniata]|uniref:Uncharacterized protein n=1 Tax=Actinomadura namibiensis TaxID=182080 RepID=A0A7W3LSP8_ACTNM|nr:hypothetical protein [Actinomadura namibiensis]MBA8953613.1 hypothetical protein [Actinomadura namibiensis]